MKKITATTVVNNKCYTFDRFFDDNFFNLNHKYVLETMKKECEHKFNIYYVKLDEHRYWDYTNNTMLVIFVEDSDVCFPEIYV